jgi:hypothetical protein
MWVYPLVIIKYTLHFADDQLIIGQDLDDNGYLTRKLIEEYKKWGLENNLDKTHLCALDNSSHSYYWKEVN